MPDPNNFLLPEYGIAFMLLPKVANTSIKWAILESFGLKPKYPGLNHTFADLVRLGGIIQQVDKRFLGKDTLKIAFVRHPVRRFMSFYRDKVLRGHQSQKLASLGIRNQMPLNDVLSIVEQTSDAASDQHFRSQSYDLMHGDNVVADFVGRFENIARDWPVVQRFAAQHKLNLGELPMLNKAVMTYQATPEQVMRIRARYARDMEVFGYA